MITQLYVVYDSKAQIYNKPFHFINHSVAVRAARELLSDPDNEISRHPSDFAMFHIGEYDDATAQIKVSKIQDCIVRFHELKDIMPKKAKSFDDLSEEESDYISAIRKEKIINSEAVQ